MVDQPGKAENAFYRMSARELFVDFFGSLVPGMVFILLAAIVLIWPVLAFLPTVQLLAGGTVAEGQAGLANSAGSLLSSFWLETLLFTLMVSYVVGHLFYRQDPKTPDLQSFKYISRDWTNEEMDEWPARNESDCEFPYLNLRAYLETRGLHHLAQLVPWVPEDENKDKGEREKAVKRTKNLINILKIRLGWHHAEKCGAISRNEAHVRLMSSMWYVSRALCQVSVAGFIFAVAGCALAFRLSTAGVDADSPTLDLVPVAMSVLGFFGALGTRRIIERFLHYQRVREIVFVLETAYTAFRSKPKEISDVCPDFKPAHQGGGEDPSA